MKEFRTLYAEEIECRVGTINDHGFTLLLYKDARCDMNILDETVGAMNWQREHKEIKGNLYGGVSIYDEDKKAWVTKWDCGTESNTEKEKGESSDSFKRACVNWGIGRELYSAPIIKIKGNVKKNEKGKLSHAFWNIEVAKIEYNDKREITLLVINGDGQEIYSYSKNQMRQKTTPKTPEKTQKADEQEKPFTPLTKSEMVTKYGVKSADATLTALEGKFGKEIANWTEDEHTIARMTLQKKKDEREEQERRLREINSEEYDDVPFPRG